ncbi:MAG: hypothetical protein CFE25_09485 [Chitinophagaceae bacterium BSSC1]|nr:MAG: hypothetical protein CFE25_09485 [Chitinophagaceae bacterium BSSC1]
MKKQIFLIVMSFLVLPQLKAQSPIDSVKNAVNDLFVAMKTADQALLASCFADSAVLQTITKNKAGQLIVVNEKVADFAASIGRFAKGDLDEQISFDVVKVDGDLAIAWTPYKFYLKTVFSHCGVNSFQLVKQKNGWKIQYLIDTRRKSNCE